MLLISVDYKGLIIAVYYIVIITLFLNKRMYILAKLISWVLFIKYKPKGLLV